MSWGLATSASVDQGSVLPPFVSQMGSLLDDITCCLFPAVASLFQLLHYSQTTVWTQASPSTGNDMEMTSMWVLW